MAILIAQSSFEDRDKGKHRYAAALQRAMANKMPPHPVYDWVKSAGIKTPTLAFDLVTIENRMQWLSELSECTL